MAATATKTRPSDKPQAPKPQAPKPEPKADEKPSQVPADVPETNAPAKPGKAGQNSAYAPEEVRAKLAERLLQMREDGWTRPAISAITGFTDSQVWRAQNNKAHTTELDKWVAFIQEVDAGKHQPPAPKRKPKPEELQARIDAALAKLAELPEKANVTALRAAVAEAKAALTA